MRRPILLATSIVLLNASAWAGWNETAWPATNADYWRMSVTTNEVIISNNAVALFFITNYVATPLTNTFLATNGVWNTYYQRTNYTIVAVVTNGVSYNLTNEHVQTFLRSSLFVAERYTLTNGDLFIQSGLYTNQRLQTADTRRWDIVQGTQERAIVARPDGLPFASDRRVVDDGHGYRSPFTPFNEPYNVPLTDLNNAKVYCLALVAGSLNFVPNLAWEDATVYFGMPGFFVKELADTNGLFDSWCNQPMTNWTWRARAGQILSTNPPAIYEGTNAWEWSISYRKPPMWGGGFDSWWTTGGERKDYPLWRFTNAGTDFPLYDAGPIAVLNPYSQGDSTNFFLGTFANEIELCRLLGLPIGYELETTTIQDWTPGYMVDNLYTNQVFTNVTLTVPVPYGSYFRYAPVRQYSWSVTNAVPYKGLGHVVTNTWLFSDVMLRWGAATNAVPPVITNLTQAVTNKLVIAGETFRHTPVPSYSTNGGWAWTCKTRDLDVLEIRNVNAWMTNSLGVTNITAINFSVVRRDFSAGSLTNGTPSANYTSTNLTPLLSLVVSNTISTNASTVVTNWAVAEGFHEADYGPDGIKTILNSLTWTTAPLIWRGSTNILVGYYGTNDVPSAYTNSLGLFATSGDNGPLATNEAAWARTFTDASPYFLRKFKAYAPDPLITADEWDIPDGIAYFDPAGGFTEAEITNWYGGGSATLLTNNITLPQSDFLELWGRTNSVPSIGLVTPTWIAATNQSSLAVTVEINTNFNCSAVLYLRGSVPASNTSLTNVWPIIVNTNCSTLGPSRFPLEGEAYGDINLAFWSFNERETTWPTYSVTNEWYGYPNGSPVNYYITTTCAVWQTGSYWTNGLPGSYDTVHRAGIYAPIVLPTGTHTNIAILTNFVDSTIPFAGQPAPHNVTWGAGVDDAVLILKWDTQPGGFQYRKP